MWKVGWDIDSMVFSGGTCGAVDSAIMVPELCASDVVGFTGLNSINEVMRSPETGLHR